MLGCLCTKRNSHGYSAFLCIMQKTTTLKSFVRIQIEVCAIFKFEFVGSIKLYVQAGIVISKRKHYLVVLQQLTFLEKLVDSMKLRVFRNWRRVQILYHFI